MYLPIRYSLLRHKEYLYNQRYSEGFPNYIFPILARCLALSFCGRPFFGKGENQVNLILPR